MTMKRLRDDSASGPGGEAPLEFSYTLTADDIYNAIKTARGYRKYYIKALVESGILVALVILFGIWWIVWDDGNAMIFCIAFACLIGVVWAVVLFSIRTTCNKQVTGECITARVWPDRLALQSGLGPAWEIPLDGTVACEEKNEILVLYIGKGEEALLPLREVPPEMREQVRQTVLQNTKRLVR